MTKAALQESGYEIVDFKLIEEEVYDIRRIYLGLILNYFMLPSIKAFRDNYEQPLEGAKCIEEYCGFSSMTRSLILTLMKKFGS